MTDRRPPHLPPPLPPRDSRRHHASAPSDTRTAQQPPQSRAQPLPQASGTGTPPRPPLPQQKFPPRPLPPGATPPRRADERGRYRSAYDDDSGTSVLKYAALALLAFVVLAGAGLGVLMLSPPADLIKSQVIAEVKKRTGRDLVIAGAATFELLPAPGITIADVTLSAPPGMAAPPLIRMSALEIRVGLMPLLGRRVEVERLVLRDPVIELRTDKAGRRNWDMRLAHHGTASRVALAQATRPGHASDSASPLPGGQSSEFPSSLSLQNVSLENVRLSNGTIAWHDERSGARQELTAVNVAAEMRDLDRPLELSGTAAFKGEMLDLSGSLADVGDVLAGRPAKLAVTVKSRLAALGFDGRLDPSRGGAIEGALSLKSSSLRDMAKLGGLELPDGGGGAASAVGTLALAGGRWSLDSATLALDGASATGGIAIQTGSARPLLTADLAVTALDFDRYVLRPKAVAGPASVAPPSPPEGAQGPRSIEELLDGRSASPSAPGTRVKGFERRAGWNTDSWQTAGLAALDADVKLRLTRAVYRGVKISQARVTATLKDKVLTANIDDMQLYEGRGRGVIRFDATAVPSISAAVTTDGVAMGPLLKDSAGMSWLAGTGRVTLTVDGQGPSQQAMMGSLTGKADVIFNNGSIVGWNLAQIIRGLKQGQLSGFERTATAKTDFSELAATWTIAGGVAENQDLRMTSPLLRVTGAGRVGLGARDIDYQLRPKFVTSLDGQGGAHGLTGLEVPLKVRGPWEGVEVAPDVGGILKDPDKTIGALKEFGKQFKGKKPDEIVDQVLGDNPQAAKKAKDLLGKFLKPKTASE